MLPLIGRDVKRGEEGMNDTDDDKPRKAKSAWLSLTLTTLLSIGATVLVAWYQMAQSRREAALAEIERVRSLKAGIVSIVEEHILNEKPIELARLIRLIDLRRREEGVSTPIGALEIVERAEYNILSSRYLEFQKKEAFKTHFETLYKSMGGQKIEFEGPYADLLNNVAKRIQEGKSQEALEELRRLSLTHRRDMLRDRFSSYRIEDSPEPNFIRLVLTFALIFAATSALIMHPRGRRLIIEFFSDDPTWRLVRRLERLSPLDSAYVLACRNIVQRAQSRYTLGIGLERLLQVRKLQDELSFLSDELVAREASGEMKLAELIRGYIDHHHQEDLETIERKSA